MIIVYKLATTRVSRYQRESFPLKIAAPHLWARKKDISGQIGQLKWPQLKWLLGEGEKEKEN